MGTCGIVWAGLGSLRGDSKEQLWGHLGTCAAVGDGVVVGNEVTAETTGGGWFEEVELPWS